jgi:hypothetical protein
MNYQKVAVPVLTDGAGAATVYSPVVSGQLVTIAYVKTDFANGSTFLITNETTGETLWSESNVNASASRAPRQPTHSVLGAASLYAATFAVNDYLVLANDRIKVAITAGGATKIGTFYFLFQ